MNATRHPASDPSPRAAGWTRRRPAGAALAIAGLLFVAGCSSPTPSYPITPQPGEGGGGDGAAPVIEEGGGGASGRPTDVPPGGGDAYATARNIPIATEDPDAPYPPPATDTPEPAYPPPDEE